MRRAAAVLVLVAGVSSPAYAHHEQTIAEIAGVAGIWIPVALLGVLGAIDRVRFWWRDGARVSWSTRRARFYCSRALAGSGWHVGADRELRYAELISPALRFELYW